LNVFRDKMRQAINHRLLRFLISGGSAAGTEYALFIALHFFLDASHLLFNQSVSFAGGFVVSFLLNRLWVFSSAGTLRGDLFKYTVIAALNLVAGNLAITFLVGSIGQNPLIAKFLVMGMIAAWNYLIFSAFIFKPVSKS